MLRMISLLILIVVTGNMIEAQNSYPFNFTYNGNPLVRNHGAADPDAHVWNDTVWLYCSQDHEIVNGNTYKTMDGYHVFSSADLIHWTDHGEVLHSRDVSWGVDGYMWAPGAARKNGKYYLYYPHIAKEGGWRVGVAISDRPEGPFKDIGHPIEGLSGIDPAVFIDDDGQAYIYNGHYTVAKLKENMIELAEEARSLDYAPRDVLDDDLRRFHEGPFMHKRNDIYYFSYSNFKNDNFQGWYAMSDNPYGPFKWMGPMAPNPQGAQDHHSVIEFKGQWYYFYHIAIPDLPANKEGQGRIACFDRLYYNEDGTIQTVVHTFGPTHVLSARATNGTIVLNPPGGAYAQGTKVTATANGNLGYTFDAWGGDLSGSKNPTTLIVNNDQKISAEFSSTPTYQLSIDTKNGYVMLNPPGGEYNPGTVVALSPVDDFAYNFSSWSKDLDGISIPATITMNENKLVKANFIEVPTYTITTEAQNGIVALDPEGGIYEKGTGVSVTAKKDFGYAFSSWSGDMNGSKNPITIIMDEDKRITANFEATNEGTIVFAINCGGASVRSIEGIIYSADKYASGGGTYSGGGSEIEGTTDIQLYTTERFGEKFSYNIPLKNDKYEVTLLFAEVFFGRAGARVFDVDIENKPVLNNFDIVLETGRNTVLKKTYPVELKDGELNISFSSVIENAKVSAIHVLKQN